MRIYIAHSRKMDYINELYKPLRKDPFFSDYELILPHEVSEKSYNTREFYRTIDLFIADCSEPATGLGIELGWAFDDNKQVYCIYQKGKHISSSIKVITNKFFEYDNTAQMVDLVKKIINETEK